MTQATVGSLTELWRYPVKSLMGERIEATALGVNGVPGDRCWAVRDEERGGIRGAKRFPKLMELAARFPEEPAAQGSSRATIVFPDGSEVDTSAPDLASRLSEFLGAEVTFWPLVSADQVDHYRRGAPASEDMEAELRATFARTPDEPLPDLSVFPPELFELESPPGTYFDAFPILLLTRQSLDAMADRAAEAGSVFDVRRFRPNLLADAADAQGPFPETAWIGRRLGLGDAVLSVEVGCPRCVMTTHGFADLPKDPTIMRALVREAGGDLGIYARVERGGRVRVGDRLELLEESPG